MKTRAAIALTLTLLGGCASAEGPPQQLDSEPACLVTEQRSLALKLEHAVTQRQKQLGLMERTSMPHDHGMLFLYQQPRSAQAGFWMYRTRMALDVAWLAEDGTILATDTMTPCQTAQARDCPTWAPGVPHRHVLELNAGYLKEHDVNTGDRLVFEGPGRHCLEDR